MKLFVQATSLLVGALALIALGCQPGIVTTPDSVITKPAKNEQGLAGKWQLVERELPSHAEEILRIEGPDRQGSYTVTSERPDSRDSPLSFAVVVEPVPSHEDYWLVQATIAVPDSEGEMHYLAYAAMKDEHLFLGQINYELLRKRLTEKQADASFNASGPFVSISTPEGKLREVLCDDPRLLVKETTAYRKSE